ncbi:MAG: CDP-diacylglycerol--serine O-phosphatidyltransferase [Methanobrevibacter thaueri]|uniref:CDP-diacylglycerol--serine O-phosphatidyltransferase n=1 Tax=Methanobrevibacter thaueri TaxID=190975 RepID=A0A8T3V492_9EURY|nr:archaetidylserine synthase [Methanobrevibacter thaueri]MBE6501353.1 CDP-diacylglycerol--serine O-phosphatidyltransferase [Methanobrevibacter thaueri]
MSDMNTDMKSFIALSDIISLLNMSSGFLSAISSINHNFELAAILMLIAIIFDSSDGWVARKINRQDDLGFGKNIDSLSDIVSFGVAPAIFIYSCINTTPGIFQAIVILTSLFIVICGVLRLTRYNVIAGKLDTTDFIGFPIPGISFVIATFYLSGLFNPYIALILSIIISLLMISNIRYQKFDNIPIIAISAVLILILILPINIIIFNINIPALILLLFCLYYLIINLIKR